MKLYRGLHRFIPTLLKMEGFTVTEIPVTNNPRLHGESKYGVWNRLFKSFRDLLAIRWMKSRLLAYEVEREIGGITPSHSTLGEGRGEGLDFNVQRTTSNVQRPM